MRNFLNKFTSRKFWAALAGLAAGLAMVFGLDEGVISTVSGAVVTLSSVAVYIAAEAKVDEKAVQYEDEQPGA